MSLTILNNQTHYASRGGVDVWRFARYKTLNVGVTDGEPWEQRTVPTALVVALTVSQTLPPTLSLLYIYLSIMKIYDISKDEYGCIIDAHRYLSDRGISCSGTKFELWLEMSIWNFIARIVNLLHL